jgi:hypothetical protein
MRIPRTILFILICLVAFPTIAQEQTPPAPFPQTYTLGNLAIQYPEGMVASDDGTQIMFDIGDNSTDIIFLYTPAALEALEIPTDDIDDASDAFTNVIRDTYINPPNSYVSNASETTFLGRDAYLHEVKSGNLVMYGYLFDVDGAFYAIMLITTNAVSPIEEQRAVLEDMAQTITLDDQSIIAEIILPTPLTNDDILSRELPTTDIALTQTVLLFKNYPDSIAVSIPQTWSLREVEGSLFSNTDFLEIYMSELLDYTFTADDVILQFFLPSILTSIQFDTRDPLALINEMALNNDMPIVAVYYYDDAPMPTYYFPLTGKNFPIGAFIILRQLPDIQDWLLIFGVAGDYDAQEALILAILDSLVYIPAETTPAAP